MRVLAALCAAGALPISVHPDNPRYLLYKGRPRVLITSTEHFGGLINLNFDYRKYLATLAANNFTLTQTWTGAYVEPDSDCGPFNTLDPVPDAYIAPWARSDEPGNRKGGNKFDLSKFNASFFERLTDFVSEANKHDIIVELGLFGGYEQTHESIFEFTPFYPGNNINIPNGSVDRTTVFSMEAPSALLSAQRATAMQIVSAIKEFDNVYFQLVSVGTAKMPGATPQWGKFLQSAIRAVDPNKMIAIPAKWSTTFGGDHNVMLNFGATASPVDAVPPVLPSQAALYPGHPLAYDESGGKPKTPDAPNAYRMSFWRWMLAGGAVVDNLDWSYMAGGYEDGTLPAAHMPETIRGFLSILAAFFSAPGPDFDFVRMSPTGPTPAWLKPLTKASVKAGEVDMQSLTLRRDSGVRVDGAPQVVLAAAFLVSEGTTELEINPAALPSDKCAEGSFTVVWTDTSHGNTSATGLSGVSSGSGHGGRHSNSNSNKVATRDSCTSSVAWHAGDLENRPNVTAADCASWCCQTQACVAFFHTVNQTANSGNCTLGAPCCWLKPTFNSTRVDDFCATVEDCMSGSISRSPTPAPPTPPPAPAPAWRKVPVPAYTTDIAFKIACRRK